MRTDGRADYRAVLHNREYVGLLLSQALSMLGDQMSRIALALLVFSRTGSPFAASATYALSYGAYLVGGPLLSTLADRYPRRSVMVISDSLRLLLVAGLVLEPPVPVIFVLIALLGAVLLEKDLGSTLVIGAIGLTVLALGGVRKRHLLVLLTVLGGLGYLAIMAASYRATRLHNYRNPFADPLGTGCQSVEALYALGSGGLGGVGLGNSVQKYQWLPEAHTDFIFAIIGEELGLIGTVSVILAFTLLLWRGVRASLRAPDAYGALLAGGITAWIGIEAFVNIGAVTGVIPTTGIPLPFISYGGTSLAMTLAGVGILCNVSAQGRRQGVTVRAHVDRRRRDGWPPDAGPGDGPGAAPR